MTSHLGNSSLARSTSSNSEKPLPLESHLQNFLSSRQQTLQPSTVRSYQVDLYQYLDWLKRYREVSSSSHQPDPEEYLNYLSQSLHQLRPNLQGSYSQATIVRKLTCVRRFYTHLCREGHLLVNPFRTICLKLHNGNHSKGTSRVLSMNDIRELISTCDISTPKGIRDRALLLILAGLGLRVAEIRDLDLSSFDQKERSLSISKKNGDLRRLPLSDALAESLECWMSVRSIIALDGKAFFVSLHRNSERGSPGLRLSRRGIRLMIDQRLAIIGASFPGGGPTLLRRSAIHHTIKCGVEMDGIRSLFGISPRTIRGHRAFIENIISTKGESDQ